MVASGVASGTVIADRLEPGVFGRVYGAAPPLLVALTSVILGVGALALLGRWGWRSVAPTGKVHGGVVRALVAGTLLAIPAIAMDGLAPLAEDVNVAPPAGLAFYPVAAWTAEVAFHLIPLAGLLWMVGSARPLDPRRLTAWLVLLAVALIEPTFHVLQGVIGGAASSTPAWVGAQVFVFGLVSLWLFRTHGFVAAFSMRLVYYLHWHVLWGQARLFLLF